MSIVFPVLEKVIEFIYYISFSDHYRKIRVVLKKKKRFR